MSFLVVANSGSQEREKKCGFVNYEVEPNFTIETRSNFDPAMDPKQLKRLISNRNSAKKARSKKNQYVANLEKSSIGLDAHVAMLRYKIKMASKQKQYLENEQKELKEYVSVGIQRCLIGEGEIEVNRAEIERLKKKMASLYCFENPYPSF